jgi:uncharacterized protein (DUF58 family)
MIEDRLRQALIEGERIGARYALGLPRQAPRGHVGDTLSIRAGSSLEFKDYRDYQPGDDLRHIDWGAYARSDQLTLKMFLEEVTPWVEILVDTSKSMALEESTKDKATLGLAAMFATAAANAGFSFHSWMLGAEIVQIVNGTGRPTTWDGVSFEYRGTPEDGFRRTLPNWRPRGIRILLSDLLWPGDPAVVLRPFTDRAALSVVVQILAKADVEPPDQGNLRLVDVETGHIHEIHIDAGIARGYRERLQRHQQYWHESCRMFGATFITVVAEQWLSEPRLDELVALDLLKVK